VLSAEEELHREIVGELDDGFVVNRDRGKRVGPNHRLKDVEESNRLVGCESKQSTVVESKMKADHAALFSIKLNCIQGITQTKTNCSSSYNCDKFILLYGPPALDSPHTIRNRSQLCTYPPPKQILRACQSSKPERKPAAASTLPLASFVLTRSYRNERHSRAARDMILSARGSKTLNQSWDKSHCINTTFWPSQCCV
jgi:hypothetical protein